MPINFGALLTGATRGLSGYREGQRLGREDKRAEDAALFSEWAKRQELQRRDQELDLREEANRNLGEYRTNQASTAAELAAIKRQIAERGSWGEQARLGPNGAVDRTIAGNVGMNDQDNQFARAIALIRASSQREPEQWVVRTDEDGQEYRVNLRTGEKQPIGIKARPTGATNTSDRARGQEAKDLATLDGAIRLAQDALDKTSAANKKGGMFGFAGPVDTRVQGALQRMQLGDQTKQAAMAAYQRVTAPELNKVIGAAMTPAEFKRLRYWLVELENAGEQDIERTLTNFLNEANAIKKERLDAMELMGRGVNKTDTRPPLDSFANPPGGVP